MIKMKNKIIFIGLLIMIIFIIGCTEKPVTRTEWFQTGNTQGITKLQTKTSEELEDNRIGSMWRSGKIDIYTKEAADGFIDDINDLGLEWVRLSIDWLDWEEVEDAEEYSEYYVDSYQDRAVESLANKDIKIMYILLYWDESILSRLEEENENFSRFRTEDEIQRYLDYVRFIVSHFKGKIEYYEILNEPDTVFLGGYVKPVDYMNLVKQVVPVIRQEDPEAKIVIPATADLEYFFNILNPDIMSLVDAVSWHPMYGTSPKYDEEYYYDYPSIVQEIKNTTSSHGFRGEYIAEELVWRTPRNSAPQEPWIYSDTVAAKYTARGVVMHLGMDILTGTILDIDDIHLPKITAQNLCTIMAGAKPIDLPVEIQNEATNIKYYTFSLSNGDKLIALWTDGIAVDDDVGVKADLIFDGFSGKEVTGIDALNGYTQPIVVNEDKIQDLIVRDYPMVIKVKK